jgi:hypothetical protein
MQEVEEILDREVKLVLAMKRGFGARRAKDQRDYYECFSIVEAPYIREDRREGKRNSD